MRVESLLNPPILFDRRPARDHDAESALDGYGRAIGLGATGIEGTAWATADGIVVLSDRDSVGGALRRRSIATLRHSSLPGAIPTLDEIYDSLGFEFDVALDVANADAAAAVIRVARVLGGERAVRRLWLINPEWERLGEWRQEWNDVRLVNRTRLRSLRRGPERRAAQLAEVGVDAVLLNQSEWTGGLTTLFHRFGRLAFACDARYERILRELTRIGIDGISSDQVERMVAALPRKDQD
ncbi:MAG: glycerophosphodiester phosphodiesterase [Actinomycetota bacterium]|nr:glycerophosphodiester phosphodiesterase [Actinomycetota bacterium]